MTAIARGSPQPEPRSTEGGSRLIAEIAAAERAERTRLADRLHDEALQLILAAGQELDEVRRGDVRALDALDADLRQANAALRSLTSTMHEDLLTRLRLDDALRRIATDAARRGRFAPEVRVDEAAIGVHDALVRDIARELLCNAARHARAERVTLDVTARDGTVVVRVEDDGRGLDPRARAVAERAGHLGLGRLERLVVELGGHFALARPAQGGTTATAWLPADALAAQGSLEDALRGERRWTAALLASLQEGLLVFRDGVTIQVNDAFCAMTAFSREELMGRTPDDYPFWPEADREYLRRTVQDASTHGGLDQEIELQRSTGERFWALCSSARIDDPAGADIGMLVTVKDLTEQRRADDRERLELELRTTIETTRRLTAMLTAVGDGVGPVLDALGRLLVDHLGWANGVINVRVGRTDRWDVAWTSNRELATALKPTVNRDEDWAVYLIPRFARRGAYFVGAGEIEHDTIASFTHSWETAEHPDAWLGDDLLLVPMREPDGTLTGLLSVDGPRSGLRPTDTQLDALVAAAEHAAGALALARRGGGS